MQGRRRAAQPQRLLVAAGHDDSWHGSIASAIYHPARDAWAPALDLPSSGVCFAQAAHVDGRAFVLGNDASPLRWLDEERGQWRVTGAPGLSRTLHACASLPGEMWVVGGRKAPNEVSSRSVLPVQCCCWSAPCGLQHTAGACGRDTRQISISIARVLSPSVVSNHCGTV